MKALVTGADGFIGRHLVHRLERDDFTVTKVDINPQTPKTLPLDIASKEFLVAMSGCKWDFIYHFGSPCSILQFNKDPVYCVRNTLKSFHNVLKVAESCDPILIYPSSGNVYGAGGSYSEEEEPKPNNLYGVCKLQCEEMASDSSVSSIGVRIFAGYGPGEERKKELGSVIYQFAKEMIFGKPPVIWGDGTQTRDFIYIGDIIEGVVSVSRIFGNLRGGSVINLGTGKSYTYNDVVKIINQRLKKDLESTYIEKPKVYVEDAVADIRLMEKVLNMTPRPLEVGIKSFIDYLIYGYMIREK